MLEAHIIQIIYLLIVTSGVSLFVKYIKFPYTIALVLFGLSIGLLSLPIDFEFNPEILLFVFLPPLIFEGTYNMDFTEFRRNIKPIFAFAIFGVILSTVFVGFLLNKFLGFPLYAALLFGAIISPTDPISVLAIFKKAGVPKRLSIILEGESIFNDGIGIVLFKIILGLVATGMFSLVNSISTFLTVTVEGFALGLLIGIVASEIIKKIDDYLIELLITIIAAYGAFLLGESFHISGVVAIAVAGLIIGSNKTKYMRPSTQVSIFTFWEFGAFIVNSFVFLLIGLKIETVTLFENFHLIFLVFLIVLLSRFISVYLISGFLSRVRNTISKKWQFMISWGGLRGTIPIALVLGLPSTFVYRDVFISSVFGVVFFSVVIGGLSIIPIVERLNLRRKTEKEYEYECNIGKIMGYKKSIEEIDALFNSGRISKKVYTSIKKNYEERVKHLEEKVNQLIVSEDKISKTQGLVIQRDLLLAQKSAIRTAEINGLLSSKVSQQLISDIDAELSSVEFKINKE